MLYIQHDYFEQSGSKSVLDLLQSLKAASSCQCIFKTQVQLLPSTKSMFMDNNDHRPLCLSEKQHEFMLIKIRYNAWVEFAKYTILRIIFNNYINVHLCIETFKNCSTYINIK